MTVQTAYTLDHAEAYAGMLVDQQIHNSVSKVNLGAVNIGFGKAIVTDTETGGKICVAGSVIAEFIGVSMRELNRAIADGDPLGAVPDYDFTIVTQGVIWVAVTEAVVKDDPVFMRVGATNTGDFSNIVGTSATLGVSIPTAKFLTAQAVVGGLAKISFNVGG